MPAQESRRKNPALSLKFEPLAPAKDTKTQPWKALCQPQLINYAQDTRADFPNIRLQSHKDEHKSMGENNFILCCFTATIPRKFAFYLFNFRTSW
ncbi:hypothetical protein V8C43DRAFT_307056 [Trichoderma afarasin]